MAICGNPREAPRDSHVENIMHIETPRPIQIDRDAGARARGSASLLCATTSCRMPQTDKDGFKILSDDELAAEAAKMRVADTDVNLGDFEQMESRAAAVLLNLMGMNMKCLKAKPSDEALRKKVRLALWDSQRCVYPCIIILRLCNTSDL